MKTSRRELPIGMAIDMIIFQNTYTFFPYVYT